MCNIRNNYFEKKNCEGKVSFDKALSLTGYGKFNLFILVAAGGCLMAVIMETMGMMFIVPAAKCDLQLDLASKGFLSASSYLGVFTSSLLWGFIADTKGRKNVILVSTFVSFVMTVFSSLVGNVWLFILLRFFNGFFIGGASAVVFAYASEFHDTIYRPKIISWMAVFVAVGNMLLPGLAWLTLPSTWYYSLDLLDITFRPWRLLLILYGLPSIIFSSMLLFLPESPKYLLSQGKNEEALEILKKIYECNTGNDRQFYPIKELISDEASRVQTSGIFRTVWEQIAPLFRRQYALKTFMVCTLQFGIFFSTNGFMMWYPELLNKINQKMTTDAENSVSICSAFKSISTNATFASDVDNEGCTDSINTSVFIANLTLSGILAIMYISIGSLINIIGKKNMFYIILVTCTAAGILLQNVSGETLLQVFTTIFLCISTCISVTNTVVVDLYPTQIRATALAISLMMGRLGAFVGSNVVGLILHEFCDFTFYIFAADHIVLIIIVCLLPITAQMPTLIDAII